MASSRTKITEIVTGLAMLGFPSVDRALSVRPDWFLNVGDDEYDLLAESWPPVDLNPSSRKPCLLYTSPSPRDRG